MPLRGGVGPLMANAILNFHFDYLTPSLIKVRSSFLGSALEVKDLMGQTRCNIMIDWGNPPDNPFNIIYERAALLQREMI